MRFNNYLSQSYIGIVKKDDENVNIQDKKVERLLKDLNMILDQYTGNKEYRFGITTNYTSPTQVLDLKDEKKEERLARRWMKVSEELEKIKDSYKNSLQNK